MRHLTTAATVICGLALVILAGSAVEQWIPGTRTPLESQVFAPPNHRVTVDVQNASGVPGAARAATERLRAVGYDVVSFGNADRFDLDKSVVIDRTGDLEMAAAVAEVLGLGRVHSELDANLFVDVTVRLGEDWNPSAATSPDEGSGNPVSWLRGVLGRD